MDASHSTRRQFLKHVGAAAVVGALPLPDLLASTGPKTTSLTILHTNDVHSRLDPFPMDGSRNAGRGGIARRMTLVQQIRAQNPNVLLFDAGDIFQGTPYFNLYKGEPEILAMNRLGYDAGTIGNHDFDGGIDNMRDQFGKASFPFLIANYDFKNTVMDGRTQPYRVFKKEGVRIGVFGLGIQPKGLIPDNLYKETTYLDPIDVSAATARKLRTDEHCDYVICLSHLGYKYADSTVSDLVLAGKSKDIDLIIGGHTHTFLDAPVSVNNADGKPIWVNQVGFAGINLGRLDLTFEKGKATVTNGQAVSVG
ncbi:bifunctional metallophosphatase/5'-nucleotidase [Fibrivirga algicola]|uniref:Twin-arginine translocation signal domain-containing protein n=1 Tax=Fibrivirga algicola TaxID=2950420 RepID=A0ABX0QI53_9BACT|nr:metallophosphatase [Fibrivirga algicola]NID10622.1 twin-arginine translocation signal domain-containing protein [Fibrivirga algicola]